jgi:hypothetical protein
VAERHVRHGLSGGYRRGQADLGQAVAVNQLE